jgi:hypothetical protein
MRESISELRGDVQMRGLAVVAGLFAGAIPAAASGGLSCNVEDQSVKIVLESGVTRGMGSPVFNFAGSLEILDKTVVEDLRKSEFKDEHLAQYWLDYKSLKLLLYRERAGDKPHGYVELTIETQAGDEENTYNGSYKLVVFDMTGDTTGEGRAINLEGQTYCFVE